MGSSFVPLFKGNVILTSFVKTVKASITVSNLIQAILPSFLIFSSRFLAVLKIGVLKISAIRNSSILSKLDIKYTQ